MKSEWPSALFAHGFVHFGLQIPLECMCTAVLRPNIFDTALIFRKTDARVAEMSINILSSVVQNPHQVHTSIVTIIMWCLAPVVCIACYGWRAKAHQTSLLPGIAMCIQWPGSHYVMGGGWELLNTLSL